MAWLDLAELDEVFRGRWLWSTRRPALAWLRRADYLGDAAIPQLSVSASRAGDGTVGHLESSLGIP